MLQCVIAMSGMRNGSVWLIFHFLFAFLPVILCESSLLSFIFNDEICQRLVIQEEMENVELRFLVSGQRISRGIIVSQIADDSQVINCLVYGVGNDQLSSQCQRKEVVFLRRELLEVSFLTDHTGRYLELCLIPDVTEPNTTNTSKPEPSLAPSTETRIIDISGPTHPFMSTQAILIPLIFFALIAFGGVSYHFELYRHLPYCAKPRSHHLLLPFVSSSLAVVFFTLKTNSLRRSRKKKREL
jgi:hypothetical protein